MQFWFLWQGNWGEKSLACPQPTLSSSCDSAGTRHVVCLPACSPELSEASGAGVVY